MKNKYKKLYKRVDWIAVIFLLVGGLAWGTIGFFSWNFVAEIFKLYANWVYAIVGLSAVWIIYRSFTKKFMK